MDADITEIKRIEKISLQWGAEILSRVMEGKKIWNRWFSYCPSSWIDLKDFIFFNAEVNS